MREYAAQTHPGLQRRHNEDNTAVDAELGLWLVADGIGGNACGEVASGIVAATICQQLRSGITLLEAVKAAHSAVLAQMKRRPAAVAMGSTVVALQITGVRYEIVWVGDSRAYLFNGKLRQLTHDHSLVATLVQEGYVSAQDALHHPQRHVVTQALGVDAQLQLKPGVIAGTLAAGESVLLCSDGLSDEVTTAEIECQMNSNAVPCRQAQGLVDAALAAGGRDNVSVVVVGADPATIVQKSQAGSVSAPDPLANSRPAAPGVAVSRQGWRLGGGVLVFACLLWLLVGPEN